MKKLIAAILFLLLSSPAFAQHQNANSRTGTQVDNAIEYAIGLYGTYYTCNDDTCFSAGNIPLATTGQKIYMDDNDETGCPGARNEINAMTGLVNGEIYKYAFEDNCWMVDFTGTNFYGHNGIDWYPVEGDRMECEAISATDVYCTVSRPTALDISMYYDMPWDSTPDADDRWHGLTAEFTAGEALSQWDLVYLTHDTGTTEIKKYDENDSTLANYKPIGIVIESGGISDAATGTVGIVSGIGRNDGWTFTNNQDEGLTVYASTTAGALTTTKSSCAVGHILDEDEIQFDFGLCKAGVTVEIEWIHWWEGDPGDSPADVNQYSPFAQYYDNAGTWTESESENPSHIYQTVTNAREAKVLLFDNDPTETGVQWLIHLPPDFIGTSIKVSWKAIITNSTAPTAGQTVEFDSGGICVNSGDVPLTLALGTKTGVDYTESGNLDAQDDVIQSDWAELTTTNVTNLGTDGYNTCLIWFEREAVSDTYNYEVGFLGFYVKFQRLVEPY